MGSFPYRNPFGYHQTWRARHFLIYAIMGGKQSFIKVVSLPYPFSLNAVSFMVASGSSASPTTLSGSLASPTPSSGSSASPTTSSGLSALPTPSSKSSAYLTPSALMPSASWWRQGRQLRLLSHRGRQLCLLPHQGRQLTLPLQP